MGKITISRNTGITYLFVASCVILVALLLVAFFERITVLNGWAIDWNAFYEAIRNGDIRYSPLDGLRPPPWSMLPLLPLGFVSMRAGWGLLTLITMMILIASVPPYRRRLIGLILLVVSFPAARVIVDGNFEGLIVGGILLMLYGYTRRQPVTLAIGVLIATIKPQTVFLLLAVLAIYVLQMWTPRLWLRCGLILAVVVGLTMLWRGQVWITAMFGDNFTRYTASLIDVTLLSTLSRAGITATLPRIALWVGLVGTTLFLTLFNSDRAMTREKVGLLTAASLLAAPYAAGNSLLVPFALAVIPLFLRKPLLGVAVVILVDAELLFNNGSNVSWISYYVTFLIILMWLIFAVQTYRSASCGRRATT